MLDSNHQDLERKDIKNTSRTRFEAFTTTTTTTTKIVLEFLNVLTRNVLQNNIL